MEHPEEDNYLYSTPEQDMPHPAGNCTCFDETATFLCPVHEVEEASEDEAEYERQVQRFESDMSGFVDPCFKQFVIAFVACAGAAIGISALILKYLIP